MDNAIELIFRLRLISQVCRLDFLRGRKRVREIHKVYLVEFDLITLLLEFKIIIQI